MPELGEVRTSKDLGYVSTTRRIWHACEVCGKERWVTLAKGKALNKRCRHCPVPRYGEKNPFWKGGRFTALGYVKVRVQRNDFFYPMASDGYVMEHRLIMAKKLKRCLLAWEVVHHINGIKDDNRAENLELLSNNGQHNTYINRYIKGLLRENESLRQEIANLKKEAK